MMKQVLALFFTAILVVVGAFSPSPGHSRSSATFRHGHVVSGKRPSHMKQTLLFMSDDKKTEQATEVSKSPAPTSGTFYDDEADSAPEKEGISDAMKQRLMSEASTGLDADTKQTNVLLYIIIAVGALVIAGGQGIFF